MKMSSKFVSTLWKGWGIDTGVVLNKKIKNRKGKHRQKHCWYLILVEVNSEILKWVKKEERIINWSWGSSMCHALEAL